MKNNNRNIHLPTSKRIVTVRGNKASVGDDSQYKRVPINLQQSNITELNFKHDKQIISSINIVKKAVEIKTISEGHLGDFHVKEDHQTQLRTDLESVLSQIVPSIWSEVERWIHKIASYLAFCAFSALAIILIINYVKRNARPPEFKLITTNAPERV